MELSYINSCFKIKTKSVTVAFDPTAKERADVAVFLGKETVSISPATRDNVFVIESEGEYELGGVGFIVDRMHGESEDSLIATVRVDGVSVVVLSGLKSPLTDKLVEKLSEGDVLVVPVSIAAKAIVDLAPLVAVLTGYESKEEIDKYLETTKFETLKRDLDKLKIDDNSLPENTEVVVLNV